MRYLHHARIVGRICGPVRVKVRGCVTIASATVQPLFLDAHGAIADPPDEKCTYINTHSDGIAPECVETLRSCAEGDIIAFEGEQKPVMVYGVRQFAMNVAALRKVTADEVTGAIAGAWCARATA